MALDFPVGTDYPLNGDQIPNGEIYEDFYWDATAGVWKRLCDRDKIGDCLDDSINETVCDRLEEIERDIIELEEEIDAIATSKDRGTWEWAFSVNNYLEPLPAGQFYMVKEDDLTVVTEYKDCGRIIFHEDDLENDNHVFSTALKDKVLMLFDRPDDDFIESIITDVEETTGPTGIVYIFHVDRRQSEGSPTNAPDGEGRYKARLNIFDEPTGGNAGEYVKKIGDTMSGDLAIDRSNEPSADVAAGLQLKGNRPSTKDSAATITFRNDQTNDLGYLTYRSFGGDSWFGFNQNVDLNNHGLHSVAQVRMKSGGYIGSGKDARLIIREGSAGEAGVEVKRTANDTRIFTILGKPSGSGSSSGNFFYAYANSGSTGDAINYTGKISSNNNIVNKAYVDSKAGGKVDIVCSSSGKTKGDMWYCNTDQTLYIKVS